MGIRNIFSKKQTNQTSKDLEGPFVKILFRFHSNLFDKEMVETMWAISVNERKNLYALENIPFYVPNVASGDVVHAVFDTNEQMLTFVRTVEYSGNSTIHIVRIDDSFDLNVVRAIFADLGCASEKANEGYCAMEIPSKVDYALIKKKLDEMEENEVISYAEACLAQNHRY